MTDEEKLAAIMRAGLTDDNLTSLSIGRLVLWMDEGVRRDEREACAKIADAGTLVPPDGGSPTQDEIDVAKRIAAAIRNRQ